MSAGAASSAPALGRRPRALGAITGGALALLAVLAIRGPGDAPRTPRQHPLPPVVSAAGLAERSGVRVVRVTVTGGGGLLDLRYQVVDPGKAAAVHDAGTPPALIYEPTGAPIEGLLMGHAPHVPAKAGVTAPLLFINPGGVVRRGDRVGVVLGGARVEHVRVR